jgi:hypothetical protein
MTHPQSLQQKNWVLINELQRAFIIKLRYLFEWLPKSDFPSSSDQPSESSESPPWNNLDAGGTGGGADLGSPNKFPVDEVADVFLVIPVAGGAAAMD